VPVCCRYQSGGKVQVLTSAARGVEAVYADTRKDGAWKEDILVCIRLERWLTVDYGKLEPPHWVRLSTRGSQVYPTGQAHIRQVSSRPLALDREGRSHERAR